MSTKRQEQAHRDAARTKAGVTYWLSTEQAAKYLGVSVSTLRRLYTRRDVPYHRLGSTIRFDPQDLDQMMRLGRVERDS